MKKEKKERKERKDGLAQRELGYRGGKRFAQSVLEITPKERGGSGYQAETIPHGRESIQVLTISIQGIAGI